MNLSGRQAFLETVCQKDTRSSTTTSVRYVHWASIVGAFVGIGVSVVIYLVISRTVGSSAANISDDAFYESASDDRHYDFPSTSTEETSTVFFRGESSYSGYACVNQNMNGSKDMRYMDFCKVIWKPWYWRTMFYIGKYLEGERTCHLIGLNVETAYTPTALDKALTKVIHELYPNVLIAHVVK